MYQTTDGGYIIAGYTSYVRVGNTDVYLLTTDAKGNEKWRKTYDRAVWGGTCFSIQQTGDGGYIIVGMTWSDDSNCGIHLIKTDENGDLE